MEFIRYAINYNRNLWAVCRDFYRETPFPVTVTLIYSIFMGAVDYVSPALSLPLMVVLTGYVCAGNVYTLGFSETRRKWFPYRYAVSDFKWRSSVGIGILMWAGWLGFLFILVSIIFPWLEALMAPSADPGQPGDPLSGWALYLLIGTFYAYTGVVFAALSAIYLAVAKYLCFSFFFHEADRREVAMMVMSRVRLLSKEHLAPSAAISLLSMAIGWIAGSPTMFYIVNFTLSILVASAWFTIEVLGKKPKRKEKKKAAALQPAMEA